MRIFVLENDALLADRKFGEQLISVGSAADCTIALPDAQIAGHQVQFRPAGGGEWLLEVLDLRLATRVNGAMITQSQKIIDRDEVSVGRFAIKIFLSMDGSGTLTKPAATSAAAPQRPSAGAEREQPLPVGTLVRSHGGQLKLPIERLHELATLTTELAAIVQIEPLVDRVLQQALATFRAAAVGLCVRLRTASGLEFIRGKDAKGQPIDAPPLMMKLHERCTRFSYEICMPDASSMGAASAMAVPLVAGRAAIMGMLYVETTAAEARYETPALDILCAFAIAISGPIDQAIHGVTQIRTALSDQSNIIARQIQDALTIRAMPEWPDLHVAALRRPGLSRPRDYYDLMRLANRTVAIVLAQVDASGAMQPRLMSEIRAAFRTTCLHADAPHVLARAVNWLVTDAQATWGVDLACVWLLPASGVIKYCVAGDKISVGQINERGEWSEFERCQMPTIGRARGFSYTSKAETLGPESILALMSDGFEHQRNAAGEAFGRKRVAECLVDTAGMAVNLMLSEIVQEMDEFVRDGQAPEDATIVLASRRE